MVEHGLYMKHCKVEVYLLEFKLAMHPKTNETVTKMFSRADTVGAYTGCTHTCIVSTSYGVGGGGTEKISGRGAPPLGKMKFCVKPW